MVKIVDKAQIFNYKKIDKFGVTQHTPEMRHQTHVLILSDIRQFFSDKHIRSPARIGFKFFSIKSYASQSTILTRNLGMHFSRQVNRGKPDRRRMFAAGVGQTYAGVGADVLHWEEAP